MGLERAEADAAAILLGEIGASIEAFSEAVAGTYRTDGSLIRETDPTITRTARPTVPTGRSNIQATPTTVTPNYQSDGTE